MVRTKREHRRNSDDSDGPLVTACRNCLKVAIRRSGLSEKALAEMCGINQKTLNDFMRGRTRRLRRGWVEKFARVLRVPVKWLDGSEQGLRYVEWQRGTDSTDFPLDSPPIGHLEQDEFIRRCLTAFRRDLRRAYNAERAGELYREWKWPMAAAFQKLMDVEDARNDLFVCTTPLTPEEFDDLTIASVDAMEIVLRPWLEGKQELNYDALAKRTGVIAGFPEADW